eukprot:334731_1
MAMQIFIELSASSEQLTIDCDPDDTIQSIKHYIQDKLGDAPQTMRLFFSGKILDDRVTLRYYNVTKESTVRLYWNRGAIEAIRIKNAYKHEPNTNTCPLMKQCDDQKTAICPAFERLKQYKYSKQDLEHMQSFTHSKLNSIKCRYGDGCKAYKRLIDGGHRLDDCCHLQIYSHPPRVGQRKSNLPQGFHPFTFDEDGAQNLLMTQRREAAQGLNLEDKTENALLELLVNELKKNKFGDDLIMPSGHSLLEVVDEKLKHPRHIAMKSPLNKPLMLSIVLYTGCDCNYDLCASQRSGNFKKWIVFDYCLGTAVDKLNHAEYGEYPVYSGVGGVMLEFGKEKSIAGFLSTFTSTSWDKNVAERFCGPSGMIVGLGSEFRKSGCDVSWISKFGNSEKEILFAPGNWVTFHCQSQTKKMQHIIGNKGGDSLEKLF